MAKTYNELYLDMRRRLREGGIADPSLEARRLLALAAECSDTELISRFFLYAPERCERASRELCSRRLRNEPLAYIAGEWEFYGERILVNPSVLIPRMDTEALVSKALELLAPVPEPRILDLCCGSGCIGVALAARRPNARIIFADISPEALSVTRKNVALHRLSTRSVVLRADALDAPPLRMENFDLLACNPPYITSAEIETLDESVKDWEPRLALDGGEDGLKFYRSVLENWKSVLTDNGTVIFEVGEGQAESVLSLLRANGFADTGTARDTIGVDRVVFGRYKQPSSGSEDKLHG